MIHGVDVSSYQPEQFPLSLPGTGQPVDFAIIKVTQGVHYVNPKWQAQADWARANGLSVGFYHFADGTDVTAQADFFLKSVHLRPGDHLWFDWESTHVDNTEKDQWIRYVQQREPEHRVGLYCNRDFWLNQDTTGFAGDGLWIADWTGAGIPPRIEAAWRIHQYEAESIDCDVADFPDRAAMKAWAGEPVSSGGGDIAQELAEISAILLELKDSVAQLGRQVADLQGLSDENAVIRNAQVQLAKNVTALPKKVAEEITKRLSE